MKKTKAVILECSGNVYSVLAEDGSFRTVRLHEGREVGEAIELKEGRLAWSAWMSAAALLLIMITAAFSWLSQKEATTVAFLSVDINPSLELRLDANSLVQGASGLNADGETLLEGLSVKGKGSGEVLALLVERAIQLHYLTAEHPWVVLGASSEGITPALPLSGLADTVSQVGEKQGMSVNVAAFQLTAGEEHEAKAKGLTPGEYGLWLSAEKAGLTLPEGAVKDSAERVRILSQEKVQAQVEAGQGTLKLGQSDRKAGPDGSGASKQGKAGVPEQPSVRIDNKLEKDGEQRAGETKGAVDSLNSVQKNQLNGVPVFQGNTSKDPSKGIINGQTNTNREQKTHDPEQSSGGKGEEDRENSGLGEKPGQQQGEKSDIGEQRKSDDAGDSLAQKGKERGH